MRRTTSTVTSADASTARAPAMTTIRRVAPYLWPDGQGWVKRRVVLSLLFLLAAKLVSVSTPYIYKLAVDNLSGEAGADPRALIGLGAVGLVVA